MTQIAIQDDTFFQLKQIAQAKQLSADQLAEQIIREHLHAEAQRLMQQELEKFRVKHPILLQRYRNEFIAMYQGDVVDHDTDQLALVLRIDDKYPDKIVLITRVQPKVEETYRVLSPRVTLS
jgi:hypothetical protein